MPKKKKLLEPIKCPVCDKDFIPKTKRVKCCSRSCGSKLGSTPEAKEKSKKTRLERYGDPNYNNREKVRRTVQEKYGEEYINTSQVPEIKNKIVKTYTEKHDGMGMASKSVSKKTLDNVKKKHGLENDNSITNVGQIKSVKDKIKETHYKNWGGIGFASEELAKRSIETYFEKYGEDIYSGTYRMNLAKSALIDKYGVQSPGAIPEIQEKITETQTELYGGRGNNTDKVKEQLKQNLKRFKDLYSSRKYTNLEIAEIMGKSLQTIVRYGKELGYTMSNVNKLNESWRLFIKKETGINFKLEGKIYGDNRKADLYNEELRLAIEINPTITHSTQPSPFHGKKVSVKYHQQRAIDAENNGWHLIQIFDWDNPADIIDFIKSIVNKDYEIVYARKCALKEIKSKEAAEFLNENHRQQDKAVGNIAYGLFYENELVQVMTFGLERFARTRGQKDYELIRLASKKGLKVIGGASKLMKAFVNSHYKPNKIKTFVDYSKGQGKVYEKMGMTYVGLANLNGLYANIDTGEAMKVTAVSYKFRKEYEAAGQTQQQFMNSKRFYRINDAGNKIYEWKRT